MADPAQLLERPARADVTQRPAPFRALDTDPTTEPSRAPAGLRWTLRCLVIGGALLAPVLAFAGERDVSLDIEGEITAVQTYAADATAALERRGVTPASADLVTPDGALSDDTTVVYRRAKSLRLVLNDEPREVVAHGVTVADALDDLGLQLGDEDAVTPGLDAPVEAGMSLVVRNAVHTKVRVDGVRRDVVTSAETIEQLLAAAHIDLGASDYVRPGLDVEPTEGMAIRVVRVRRAEETKRVRIPFRTVTRHDPELESGERRVIQQGAEGLKVQTFRVVHEDGVRVSTTLKTEEIIRSSRDHIVKVGTKEPTFDGGGNSQGGVASWYGADGLIAAHKTLPFGTVVRVTNLENGRSVTVRIADRGPFVEGRVIDLSDDAFKRVAPLGKGTFKSKIEW